ncbi:MAG: hypothetical protein PHY73_05030 [Candidatus Omnitrophica bacterium]|nr:hypothetical protein [Candidatus Omnitrophota bacterium]
MNCELLTEKENKQLNAFPRVLLFLRISILFGIAIIVFFAILPIITALLFKRPDIIVPSFKPLFCNPGMFLIFFAVLVLSALYRIINSFLTIINKLIRKD